MLCAKTVNETFLHCLFHDEEIVDGKPPDNAMIVEGVMGKFELHPGRLAEKRSAIRDMMDELPAEFDEGWSFLNMCMDKHGNHWAEHPTVNELVVLGLAIGALKCLAPRELWPTLPGGMPYFVRTRKEG